MDFKNDISYRKQCLVKLLDVIIRREKDIVGAVYKDFSKPEFEAVLTETILVQDELKQTIRNIRSWSRRKRVWPSIVNFPSSDFLYPEPYGDVLIISPWNYPYQLAMMPMIAAVAAGNRVVLKPSENAPNTAEVLSLIISEAFDSTHVEVVLGDADVAEKLLERRWDYIFFTGSVAVGKKVAAAAAVNLTPVTLELGGKNPCIVDESANLQLSAKRIVWGKFINAGQTCIAPDYLLVHKSVKAKFTDCLIAEIESAYGKNQQDSPDLPRIINEKQWQRLADMIHGQPIVYGGKTDKESRYISPTIIDNPGMETGLMADEIFGPILPILSYKTESDIESIISRYEKPLSLYVFTSNREFAEKIIRKYSFGGGCINDTVVHYGNGRLPFGGVGHSGIGAYHGKRSFDTFTHYKPVVKKATWLDIPLRYAPYKDKVKTVRQLFKWL